MELIDIPTGNDLDSILTYAVRKKVTISKASVKNQRMSEKIIIMEYMCPGIGKIKLTVGVRKSTHEAGWTFSRMKPLQSIDFLTFAKIIIDMLKKNAFSVGLKMWSGMA